MHTIDLYTLDGCNKCTELKKDIQSRISKGQTINITNIYEVKEENGAYYVFDKKLNTKDILRYKIDSYPYMKIHKKGTNITTDLYGDAALNYIKDGYVHNKKLCPLVKLKPCVGDKCSWWQENERMDIIFGGCSIPIIASNIIEKNYT